VGGEKDEEVDRWRAVVIEGVGDARVEEPKIRLGWVWGRWTENYILIVWLPGVIGPLAT
jgi:hypothetical protein